MERTRQPQRMYSGMSPHGSMARVERRVTLGHTAGAPQRRRRKGSIRRRQARAQGYGARECSTVTWARPSMVEGPLRHARVNGTRGRAGRQENGWICAKRWATMAGEVNAEVQRAPLTPASAIAQRGGMQKVTRRQARDPASYDL